MLFRSHIWIKNKKRIMENTNGVIKSKVTGHSYVVYGPLLHGATEIMYEGVPDYPDTSRIWDIIDRYGVTIFYTTPTALRMFMKFGDAIPNSFKLSSLRLLGTVGEPINPEVWIWYFKTIGKSKCPIIDTWWQTETGGMILSTLPGLETISLDRKSVV